MTNMIIEIHPKKPEFDPLAKQVRSDLIERGETPATAAVQTQRLFKIEGNFDVKAIQNIADTLLVDPVVETVVIDDPKAEKKAKKKTAAASVGFVLDIWPKPGVTDPVGETVEKGLHDLGYQRPFRAASAMRYVFPKTKTSRVIEDLAKKVLANELIHDIRIRKI